MAASAENWHVMLKKWCESAKEETNEMAMLAKETRKP